MFLRCLALYFIFRTH